MAAEVPAAGLSLSESHPLSEELSSLRALVARFQVCIIVHCLSFGTAAGRGRETVFVLLPNFVRALALWSFSILYLAGTPRTGEGTSRLSLSPRAAVPSLEELAVSIVSSHPDMGDALLHCGVDRAQVARGVRVRLVGREERVRRGLGAAVGRVDALASRGEGEAADVRAVLVLLDVDVSSSSPSPAPPAPRRPRSGKQALRRPPACVPRLSPCAAGASKSALSLPPGKTQNRVLQSAVERLHDYTEDARVELEIRVADGRMLSGGWETIVLLPGRGGGTAAYVARDADAQAGFQRKLDDVEHDIAVVKRAVYAPPSLEPTPPISPAPVSPWHTEGWAAWLGGGSGRRTPPSPGGHAPTFGIVMTSPRLRHSSSAARLAVKYAAQGDPFERLGLRVPMPTYVPQQQQQAQAALAARQRTISGVYMLGLGVGHNAVQGRRPSGLAVPTRGAGGGDGGDEGDVEPHIRRSTVTLTHRPSAHDLELKAPPSCA
ncbi:hypothetical protein B0H14DRAFT_3437411 [Mycena olivaceomarginata]|nr:hypothetical protein B0H14DRAFT_3437411 [Mycena olivaceomarginata]